MPGELSCFEAVRDKLKRVATLETDLTRFVRRGSLFLLPFVFYAASIAFIDPYDYLTRSPLIPQRIKLQTSYPLNYYLWKMKRFEERPFANILLGDSRMNHLSADKIREATRQEYFNFAYGGATLKEITDTFWFAAKRVPLRNVYLGINFNLYNGLKYKDGAASYFAIARHPLLYFVNRSVIEAAFYNVYARLLDRDLRIGTPNVTREEFWAEQLGPNTDLQYRQYVYPAKYHADLRTIADYCKAHGVKLTFIIFPTHVDLQRRVGDFALDREYVRFKADLSRLAPTLDYDYDGPLTEPRDNFSDPYHYVDRVGDLLVTDIWSGEPRYGRRLS